jgi:hypothetical protein
MKATKGNVGRHNTSFRLEEIRSLFQTAAENIKDKGGQTAHGM